ncbi:TGS domain-containing protein [Patescibacteria group bacterium]
MNKSQKITKVKEFSKNYHQKEIRKCGNTCFDHIQGVVDLLIQNGIEDEDIIVGTYLHHIFRCEDTPSEEKIIEYFGNEGLEIAKSYNRLAESELTHIYAKDIDEALILQAFLNLVDSPKALILRLADKVENIKTAYALEKDQSKKVAERALYIYAPICRLLGVHNFVNTLENEAFKILHPDIFFNIQNYLEKNLPELQKELEEIAQFTKEILNEKEIKSKIDYRIKHVYSIYRKQQKYRSKDLSTIYDIAAMRIILDSVEDCYAVEGVLKQIWDYLPEERDDYIQNPKTGGYQSIHNTFKVSEHIYLEIQIKTHEMHQNNEFGIASHAFYKIGNKLKKKLKRNPDFLKHLNFLELKSNINLDEFKDKIYVFTPKADIIELPLGANAIDFAYAIHKDLGDSCVGALINNEFKAVTTKLKSGDRVEIKTSKNKKKPSRDWIKEAKTKKAINEIKRSLRETT